MGKGAPILLSEEDYAENTQEKRSSRYARLETARVRSSIWAYVQGTGQGDPSAAAMDALNMRSKEACASCTEQRRFENVVHKKDAITIPSDVDFVLRMVQTGRKKHLQIA